MKKFKYSMQSILDIKLKLEEQEKNNYAQAQMRLNAENEKLAALVQRRGEYEEHLRQMAGQRLDIPEMRRTEDAIEVMKGLIRQQTVAVRKAEQNVEAALHRLRQAMTEKKAQEKLREKAWSEYMMEFEAQERKEIDELVSFRFGTGNE